MTTKSVEAGDFDLAASANSPDSIVRIATLASVSRGESKKLASRPVCKFHGLLTPILIQVMENSENNSL
jgi:hypothetical protein